MRWTCFSSSLSFTPLCSVSVGPSLLNYSRRFFRFQWQSSEKKRCLLSEHLNVTIEMPCGWGNHGGMGGLDVFRLCSASSWASSGIQVWMRPFLSSLWPETLRDTVTTGPFYWPPLPSAIRLLQVHELPAQLTVLCFPLHKSVSWPGTQPPFYLHIATGSVLPPNLV